MQLVNVAINNFSIFFRVSFWLRRQLARVFFAVVLALCAVGFAQAECNNSQYETAVNLVEDAIELRQLTLIKGASVLTLAVDDSFWARMDSEARRGVLMSIECAIAGPNATLKQVVIKTMYSKKVVAKLTR